MLKKAQADMKELALTLVIVGVVAIVGVLIFTNVSNTTNSILDPDITGVANETVTNISMLVVNDNSSLLATDRFILNSERIKNSTDATNLLVRGTDYVINGVTVANSGQVGTFGNLTLIDLANNNTEFKATYSVNTESEAQATTSSLETTVLDSFSLGVIALIVLAAVVILSVLFRLGATS